MRTSVLISLLSAAVVIAEPTYTPRDVAYTLCAASNATTACSALTTVWTDTVCASVATRLVSAPTSVAYSTNQCLPRVALVANTTIGNYTLAITSLATAGTAGTYTTCTSETGCDANSCCVEAQHSVNGTSVVTSKWCGARTSFLDMGLNTTVTASTSTVTPANTLALKWLCTKDLNPIAYAAKWEADNATLFKFSMAVIFGLLALFAY